MSRTCSNSMIVGVMLVGASSEMSQLIQMTRLLMSSRSSVMRRSLVASSDLLRYSRSSSSQISSGVGAVFFRGTVVQPVVLLRLCACCAKVLDGGGGMSFWLGRWAVVCEGMLLV